MRTLADCPKHGVFVSELVDGKCVTCGAKLSLRNSQSKCLTCANVADACTPDDPDSPCGDEPERKADLCFREKTSNK